MERVSKWTYVSIGWLAAFSLFVVVVYFKASQDVTNVDNRLSARITNTDERIDDSRREIQQDIDNTSSVTKAAIDMVIVRQIFLENLIRSKGFDIPLMDLPDLEKEEEE